MEKLTQRTRTASKWILAIAVTLLFQLLSFAQDPADFGGGDNPTDAPTEPLPIDDSVFVLLAIGIGYAFYNHKKIASRRR